MSKLQNKQMVEKIKKLAQIGYFPGTEPPKTAPATTLPADFTGPPAPGQSVALPSNFTGPPAPGQVFSPPKAPTTAPMGGRDPNVVKMQVELKNLASALTSQVDFKGLGGVDKDFKPTSTPEQMQAAGRMSFADFITQHYTRDSDIPGVEFDWDPNKTQMSDKSPSKPTRTNVVMDTMQRIGNPTLPGQKPEFAVDGVWGPRTNAALRNAYAMGFGLLEMAKDFHYQSPFFTEADKHAMHDLIPSRADAIDAKTKSQNAIKLANYLKAIRALFQEMKEHIFNKTDFKPYIEGSVPYTTYTPGSTPDPAMITELNNKFTNLHITGNVGGKNVVAPITINDLTSTQALTDWQKHNMPSMSSTDILQQLNKYLDTNPTKAS